MKKILNEWKFFLRENSRFEIDPEVQRHLAKILLGKIDYPQVYNYTDNGAAYKIYMDEVRNSDLIKAKEEEIKEKTAEKEQYEKRTPPRRKILSQIGQINNEIGNILGGLSYYWDKYGGPNLASYIVGQKLQVFLAQLSPEQQADFRQNYPQYLGFNEGSMGVAFPAKLPRKTKLVGDYQVDDVWLVNDGRDVLENIVSSWARSTEV